MKELIRKVLKESVKEKLQKKLEEDGLSETLSVLRITFEQLLKILNLTKIEKYSLYQLMIDEAISIIKHQCETMNDEDNEYISVGACDFIDALVNLKVVDIPNDTTIKLRIEYIMYLGYLDEDTFIYELKEELNKYGKFKIDVEELINIRNNRQW